VYSCPQSISVLDYPDHNFGLQVVDFLFEEFDTLGNAVIFRVTMTIDVLPTSMRESLPFGIQFLLKGGKLLSNQLVIAFDFRIEFPLMLAFSVNDIHAVLTLGVNIVLEGFEDSDFQNGILIAPRSGNLARQPLVTGAKAGRDLLVPNVAPPIMAEWSELVVAPFVKFVK
jgi:hypothetical protein